MKEERKAMTDGRVMRDALLRRLARVFRRLPVLPFRKSLVKAYERFAARQDGRTVEAVVGEIRYRLDLREAIDSNLYYLGDFEPDATATVNRLLRPGMTAFDVGANMGYFTLTFAKLVGASGRVVAFEPTTWALGKLRRNIDLNGFSNITVEQLALSDVRETRRVDPSEAAFRASWVLAGGSQRVQADSVRFLPLDDYVRENEIANIDLMKVDVDGYEYRVIHGAKSTLKELRPIVLIEIGGIWMAKVGDSSERLVAFIADLGYSFFTADGQQAFSGAEELLRFLPEDAVNVLCVPTERRSTLATS